MRTKWLLTAVIIQALFLLGPIGLQAQESQSSTVKEEVKGIEGDAKVGWTPVLKASANLALDSNRNVPGAQNGVSMAFGYIIAGGIDFLTE